MLSDGYAAPGSAVYRWLLRLRWLAIGGVAVALIVAGPVLGVLGSALTPALWGVLFGLACYNVTLGVLGPHGEPRWLTHFAAQIVVDCLALALLVHFGGGAENPFLPLFVLHVVNANIVLRPRPASSILLFAGVLASSVVLGEATGVLTHHCIRPEQSTCSSTTLNLVSFGVLGGLVMTLVASSFFARYLTTRLHESERSLAVSVDDLSTQKERLAQTRVAIEFERSRLQAIIDCMADAVTFSDPDGRVVLSNARARQLLGSTALPECPDPMSPESLRTVFAAYAADRNLPPDLPFERGGRSYEATCAVVRDESGAPLGTVTVARDISDRMALERRLMHDERMAVVGKLAAAVAHEINNPIGVVSLYAQHALAKLPQGSPIEGHLETIRRNAESCRKVTGSLLELARTGKPERRPVDLRLLCRDVAQSVAPLAAQVGVKIETDGASAGPSIWAEGDVDQLRQAVLNLALNAIEACSEGDRVSLRAFDSDDSGGSKCGVEVRDSGPGIPDDQIERIFLPFYTTKATGTGLGLAVADNIVKGHAGRITVENGLDGGAAFRIELPVFRSTASFPALGRSEPPASEAGA